MTVPHFLLIKFLGFIHLLNFHRERLRKERGEPGSDEEEAGEDIVDGGDPFKKLSLQELQEKV